MQEGQQVGLCSGSWDGPHTLYLLSHSLHCSWLDPFHLLPRWAQAGPTPFPDPIKANSNPTSYPGPQFLLGSQTPMATWPQPFPWVSWSISNQTQHRIHVNLKASPLPGSLPSLPQVGYPSCLWIPLVHCPSPAPLGPLSSNPRPHPAQTPRGSVASR